MATLAPYARMSARNFRLRIELREIDLRENVRLRIAPAQEILVLIEQERSNVELAGPVYNELRRRTRTRIDHSVAALVSDRLY